MGHGLLVNRVLMCHAYLLFVYLLLLLFTHRKLEESKSGVEGDSLPVLLHKTTGQDVSDMDCIKDT